MNLTIKKYSLLLFLIFAMYMTGCVRSSNPDVERGSTFRFQDGYPEIRMSSIGILSEDDEPLIDITTDIVLGSLIYSTNDEGIRTANVSIEIRILQQNGDFNKTLRNDFVVESEYDGSYQSQDVFSNRQRIEVVPGQFEVTITVLDQSSGKASSRTSEADIPDPQNPEINLTTIRLMGKHSPEEVENPQFFPITTYTASSGLDSLQFMFQVTNNNMEDPLT
ncbi:MAG: hypothetical protein RI573_13225, partial [Balneolaceae bacterium]|nr:hypothetical protein [Balneolaceae bacterium]